MNVNRSAPLREGLDWFPKGGIDIGLYSDALKEGKTLSMWLEEEKSQKLGKQSSYLGLTRSEVIEKKKALKDSGQDIPYEALDECFEKAGIKAFGKVTDKVDKMYEYSDIDVLFPEFVNNRVYAGMLAESLVDQLIAFETVLTDSIDYRKIYIDDAEEERQTGIVGIGAELAETMITVADQSVKLKKYGRYISMAFEELKYQRLNLFGVVMQRLGQQIQIDLTDDLMVAIESGDGNSSTTPGTTVAADTSGTVAVADLIEFFTCLPTPYKMTDLIGRKALLVELFTALVGMYNPMTAYGVPGLNIPNIHEWDRQITSDYYLGIDKRYSVEMVTTGGVQTDSESFVKKQIKGTGIWHLASFGVIDENANAIFNETA